MQLDISGYQRLFEVPTQPCKALKAGVGAASSAVVSVVNGGGVVCAAEATGVGFWAEWQEVARATVTRHAMKA